MFDARHQIVLAQRQPWNSVSTKSIKAIASG
jgi:hypothetical protein